jgi:superfamily II helicase
MNGYGYYIEGSVICPNCAAGYDLALLVEEEAIGYPDGYTCDECDTTVKEITNE